MVFTVDHKKFHASYDGVCGLHIVTSLTPPNLFPALYAVRAVRTGAPSCGRRRTRTGSSKHRTCGLQIDPIYERPSALPAQW